MKKQRGFTLIELVTAMAIMVIVVAGITQVLVKQSQASSSQNLQRDLEESGRLALLEIARNVRLAGYGITPYAAFDFARYACTNPDTATSCNGNKTRDRNDGPDELVLSYRDPSFSRVITAANSSSVSFAGGLTQALQGGTIVQLISQGGTPVSYLKVATAGAAIGATSINLSVLDSSSGYYEPSTAPTTFTGGVLTLVTRVRYFIANDTDGVPSLFKERGRGNELLYRGIEDLQFSYDIGQPPAGSAFAAVTPPASCGGVNGWTFGVCVATTNFPPETTSLRPDWQNDAYDSANRYTGYPANIRTVNISIVARSTRASPDGAGDPVPLLFNRPARVADKFKRTVLQMSEKPQNLLARQYFQPIIIAGSDSIGGG